jgi:hypothetical protein
MHAGHAAERRDGQNKMRRMDNRKGQGNGRGDVRKEVAGGSSKVADAGVDSGGRSRFGCDARLDGQPQLWEVETAPSTFGQRQGRSTSAKQLREGEEKRRGERNGTNGTSDKASMYDKWGAYFDARSRGEVEKRKVTEQKEAPRGGANFSGRGPADVNHAKANKKRKEGVSPQRMEPKKSCYVSLRPLVQ